MSIDPKIIGDAFYSKLFADHPALRKMFPTEMDKQYIKLVDMLSSIIMSLDQIESVSANIVAMSKRHNGYGVKAHHYTMVGNALLWTLRKGLGAEWNQDVESAWNSCYQSLANVMIEND